MEKKTRVILAFRESLLLRASLLQSSRRSTRTAVGGAGRSGGRCMLLLTWNY